MKYIMIFFTTGLIVASLTSAAFASHVDRMLHRIDKNDDGKISLDEFKARDTRWFERLDSNGDGAVSLEEINQHHSEMSAERQAKMAARWAEMQATLEEKLVAADTNEDGLVTREELRLEAFNRIDDNDDGFLTKEELKNARHDRGGKGFRHGGGFRKGRSDKTD